MPEYPYNPDIGQTDLMGAAYNFSIVRMLVAAGANIGLHGGYGQRTAECIARHKGYHEISEFLCYHEKRPST